MIPALKKTIYDAASRTCTIVNKIIQIVQLVFEELGAIQVG